MSWTTPSALLPTPEAQTTRSTRITVAHGDGIGPEIMAATLHVLQEAGARLDVETIEIGESVYRRGYSAGIQPEAWDSLRRTRVFLKAPITTPQGGGFKSLNVTVRKTLGLYANVRPCAAYAPFMNGGYKATPHIIRRISTADGKVLYENTYDNPPRVLEPNIVSMMNGMMMRVITEGTGKNARIPGWPAAGKSGTTQSFRDALFVGYTSNLTTGVWFGNDDGKSMKKVTGGGLPAKAWSRFMTAAHEGLSPSPLFGTAGGGIPMAGADPAAPAGREDESLAEMVARALGTSSRDGGGEAMAIPDRTGGIEGDLPVPPADVGEQPARPRRSSLLDVLIGG